ncbi:MAG: Deoxyuridine 5'-triphosphate nucleotidohydrolase [Candidatus Woesebacteria bacterium GW2011_GWA1_45_8]|uniref:dUTP diphosphatase n=1 Tax=Candidatus Woesebacteria bacterium GW2011_GWA1_45_8 TaxID=1618559 RepID=A0A0G1QTZ8_9BACT|nr:MAG: Deoxyuridine 5'-triphosphate nucleotidohydrolase [Candidatus Woesebacteria bacterium GW2011_GWA1_45_8]
MERKERRPVLKFLKLHKDAILPAYVYEDDAAFGLSSIESFQLKPREVRAVPTGLAAEIPAGWFVSFRGRGSVSSLGVDVLAGVIDAGYRGEWKVVLANVGRKPYKVQKGERIAQGILQPAPQAKIIRVDKLSETKRGGKGFGSTGRK